MASIQIGKRAVVIGAGMAGLTAAGALADHFDNIVVLERDTLPSEPLHRAGTPQARHAHALLLSGQRALSELFLGFEEDLARAGAVRLKVGLDVRVERPGYIPSRVAISVGSLIRRRGRPSSTPCDIGWKAVQISGCASDAVYMRSWGRQTVGP